MAFNEIAATKSVAVSTSVASDRARENDFSSSPVTERGYEVDVLSQFRANLEQVEELNARLRFVLGEVSGLLSKRL